MKDLEKIRKSIHLLKPKTLDHLEEDLSNLDDILTEYDTISTTAKDLVKLPGKNLSEALATQPAEYHFFRRCSVNLRGLMEFMDASLKHARGTKYDKIRRTEAKDINDRAINSLIDADPDILGMTFQYLRVKDMYDRFQGIVDSYNQRGFALNNMTKALEVAAIDYLIQ